VDNPEPLATLDIPETGRRHIQHKIKSQHKTLK